MLLLANVYWQKITDTKYQLAIVLIDQYIGRALV